MVNCIYCIKRKSDDVVVYVGSTRNLPCRELNHTLDLNRKSTRKAYKLINENGGWENHKIECLEETEKESTDLLWLERKHYDELKPIGNSRRPICSEEERKQNEQKSRAFFFQRWKKQQK